MTIPFPDNEHSGPRKARRNWLLRFLDVQEKYEFEIVRSLNDAAEDAAAGVLARLSSTRTGDTIRRSQLRMAARAAKDTLSRLFSGLKDTVRDGQSAAALAAVEAGFVDDERYIRQLFIGRPEERDAFLESRRYSAQRGVEAMMARVLVSHKPLAETVYHTRALANGQIDRIVNSALVKGDSAADIAKAVRGSIRPDVPGGISYAARRLGRTEINNAFHAQSIGDAIDKPFVVGLRWRLSKVHEEQGCKCEIYAKTGVFDTDKVPEKPHPQCMCYTTPEMVPWTTFETNLRAGLYNGYIGGV